MHRDDDIPPGLLEIATALEQHRAELTDLEHARIKRRAIGRTPRTSTEGSFVRSRIAILATLVTGLVMTSGSAALGITALTNDHSASSAQYGVAAPTAGSGTANAPTRSGARDDAGETLGSSTAGDSTAGGNDAPSAAAAAKSAGAVAQAPRQVGAIGGEELPFTGYASIPLLLIGIALLITGLMLRRSTNRSSAA